MFDDCFHDHKHNNYYKSIYNNVSLFIKDYARIRLSIACGLSDDNSLLVLSGFALAIFTFTLWWSTHKLWKAAEAQRADDIIARREDARRTAAALAVARQSAEAAERASHVERAWVSFDTFIFGRSSNIRTTGGIIKEGFQISAKWTNTGRTPAIMVQGSIYCEVIDYSNTVRQYDNPTDVGGGVIGTSKSFFTTEAIMSMEGIESSKRMDKMFIVHSCITYFDVFNPTEQRLSEVTIDFQFKGTVTTGGETGDNIFFRPIGMQNRCS